jgi:NIMA (never in mitosis gene a)-related kinase
MSPEIMENKRYNSKTDIWSLGCILYELMLLKLPFEGNNMRELTHNILTGNGGIISSGTHFSASLRDIVNEMLLKNSNLRPGINAILSRPVIKARISCFLDATKRCREFSHTVIHGMKILEQKVTPTLTILFMRIPMLTFTLPLSQTPNVTR